MNRLWRLSKFNAVICFLMFCTMTLAQAQGLGGLWRLEVRDLDNQVRVRATIRFETDEVRSCMSQGWARVAVVSKLADDEAFFPLAAPLAYKVDETGLTFGRAEVCDAYLFLTGKLAGASIRGDYNAVGWGTRQRGTFSLEKIQSSESATSENVAKVSLQTERELAELPYRVYLELEHQLYSRMPPEPRLVDMWFRVAYPDTSASERDQTRARPIVIRSEHVNLAVQMWKGSYFILPSIREAYDESAAIVIGGTSRAWLGVWWSLRVPDDQRISYADIRLAREQIAAVQNRISGFATSALKHVKRQPYDGIKACFSDEAGTILLNGRTVADAVEGNCKILFTQPERIAGDQVVEFSGPLESVIFIDTRYYWK